MKKYLIVVAALCLTTSAFAQRNNIVFGGLRYSTTVADGEKKLILMGGYGFQISGHLWTLNTGEVGTSGYVALDPNLAYMFTVTESPTILFTAGLIAGPNADWVKLDDTASYRAYIPGAVGGILYVEGRKNGFGAYVAVREKFALTQGTQYDNGFTATVGLSKRF